MALNSFSSFHGIKLFVSGFDTIRPQTIDYMTDIYHVIDLYNVNPKTLHSGPTEKMSVIGQRPLNWEVNMLQQKNS